MFIFIIFIEWNTYDHFSRACVREQNIIKYSDTSISECKALCSERVDCFAFEYGVEHGGDGSDYKPKDCQLKSSADQCGCNGKHHNLDLYVKLGMFLFRE